MGAIFGFLMIIAGILVLLNSFIMITASSIHQIFQALNALIGVVLLGFGCLNVTVCFAFKDFKLLLQENKKESETK